jgi:hypothetical protein
MVARTAPIAASAAPPAAASLCGASLLALTSMERHKCSGSRERLLRLALPASWQFSGELSKIGAVSLPHCPFADVLRACLHLPRRNPAEFAWEDDGVYIDHEDAAVGACASATAVLSRLCCTAGYLRFGPIDKIFMFSVTLACARYVFCDVSVREKDWCSRARGAQAT